MSEEINLQIQQQFVAAVFAGEAATIRALCTSDFTLAEGSGLPFAGTYHGAEGFLEFLGLFNETFEIEHLTPVRTYFAGDPDRLACEFDLRGVLRATGKLFESSIVELWHFRQGQVAAIKPHYFNAV